MKKLAIFPANRDSCAIARHASLLDGYSSPTLLLPGFYRMHGMDISVMDGGDTANISFVEYNEKNLTEYDTVFIGYDNKIMGNVLYKEAIDFVTANGNKVILSQQLLDELKMGSPIKPIPEWPATNHMYDINIPVIILLTQGLHTNQFTLELKLRKSFMNKGYKVGQIGSREYAQLFGYHELPDFLCEDKDATHKIVRLNHLIKDITEHEKPDLLILSIPDPIMKYNNAILNGLGVIPFVAGSAVKSDIVIVCTYYETYRLTYFEETSLFCHYRFGCPAQFFGLTNAIARYDPAMVDRKMEYITLDNTVVTSGMQDMEHGNYYIFNPMDDDGVEGLCRAIEVALSENITFIK